MEKSDLYFIDTEIKACLYSIQSNDLTDAHKELERLHRKYKAFQGYLTFSLTEYQQNTSAMCQQLTTLFLSPFVSCDFYAIFKMATFNNK